jgi:hypothetical protein
LIGQRLRSPAAPGARWRLPRDGYTPSSRVHAPPPEPEYPYQDRPVRVTGYGRICRGKRKNNLSTVLAGQIVGIREAEDRIWLVNFLGYGPGYFDNEMGPRGESGPDPFEPDKALTMCPEYTLARLAMRHAGP